VVVAEHHDRASDAVAACPLEAGNLKPGADTARQALSRRHTYLRSRPSDASCDAMFVIELTYKASLAEIDASMAAHVKFLKKYYAAGNFLISGRKIPRDGGMIVAVGKSRQQIEGIIREDPFHARGLADFRVIEFRASQRADDIQKRIDG
jgi:uncharacterized protein YciI